MGKRGAARSVVAAGLVMVAALLIALDAPAEAQTESVDVILEGNAFKPKDIVVLVGTTVTWTQMDDVVHTVTVEEGQPESWEAIPFLPANAGGVVNTGSHVFEELGTTRYFCEVHASTMRGSVTVVESLESPLVTVNSNDDSRFDPELVAINATEGVVWINSGTFEHTVTFEDPSIGDLGAYGPGDEVRFNFTTPGSYRYRCTYHSEADFETGMVGKVAVGGNATFPTVVTIQEPGAGATLTGSVNVSGSVRSGAGQAAVTKVEIGFDDAQNWTEVGFTPGTEFWAYVWDSSAMPNGNHTIHVRALANETTAANDSVLVLVQHPQMSAPMNERPVPGPAFTLVLLVVPLAAILMRRRGQP